MLERIHLSIVQQVEQQGSLTAAAGVLNLTQSALSHSMKKLEQQLGTDVWLREGRSLRLTPFEKVRGAAARNLRQRLERLRQLVFVRIRSRKEGVSHDTDRYVIECHPQRRSGRFPAGGMRQVQPRQRHRRPAGTVQKSASRN